MIINAKTPDRIHLCCILPTNNVLLAIHLFVLLTKIKCKIKQNGLRFIFPMTTSGGQSTSGMLKDLEQF